MKVFIAAVVAAGFVGTAVPRSEAVQAVKANAAGPGLGVDPHDDSAQVIITDLNVTETLTGIRLDFTSSLLVKVTDYIVKMADIGITPSNWDSVGGTDLGTFPHAGIAGSPQQIDIPITLSVGTHHFALRCLNAGAKAGFSNDDTLTIVPDTTPPAAVANLAAAGSGYSIVVSWSAPADDATEIQVSYATASNSQTWTPLPMFSGASWGPITPTSHSLTYADGLTPEVPYFFTARCRDAAGNMSPVSLPTSPGVALPAQAGGPDGGGDSTSGGGCAGSAAASTSMALLAVAAIGLLRRA